ncbi:hypothetical protein ACFL2H_03045 [Planctomycetota bacterium]
MHTIELLNEALQAAELLGYGIRHEWLGGSSGGACEVQGKKWLFVDLALTTIEQFEQVLDALRRDAAIHTVAISSELARELRFLRTA